MNGPASLGWMKRPQTLDSGADTPACTAAVIGEAVHGCGWFDSSHALLQGLSVSEHAADDAVVAALPLAHWLALQLGRGVGAGPAT